MHVAPTRAAQAALVLAFLVLATLALVLPYGSMAPMGESTFDPRTGKHAFVHDDARMAWHGLANAAGSIAFLLALASIVSGYAKARWLRRHHARMGIVVLVLALVHTLVYVLDGSLRGWAPGTFSLLAFGAHGATGARKARLLRAWGAAWWRVAHRATAWAALALTVEHVLMASWHYGFARWLEEARL